MNFPRPLVHSAVILIFGLFALTVCFAKENPKLLGSISLKGKTQSEYSSLATLSIQDAISIAAKLTSGKVTEAALENEDGYLVYEIEITSPDLSRRELLIDAGNGAILQSKRKKASADDEDSENMRDGK